MATRLIHDIVYDAPLAEVSAMLGDPSFREDVCTYQRVLRSSVRVDDRGGGTRTVVVEQVQPAKGIPSFAKKFVGNEIDIVQREEWTTEDAAELHVTIPGKPGEMLGTIALAESGGLTTETVDVTIKVHLPLVGGKIEGLIADLLRKALDAENAVGRDYLSR
ncbi:MAG: DUF2505 domain-containing protein [Nocardioides sp.]|nr:DUF2505 domain-containing protein [Nocardioidaceae bacterium]MCB8958221.1 DUF2505 domain-containing protein [Nocardioides sp.]